jgi:hypothetical protein
MGQMPTAESAGPQAGPTAPEKPFGPVAAVFLAAGIGTVVLGILTTLAEASDDVASALEWSTSVGPLMGKTIIASGSFFVAWGILHVALRARDPAPRGTFLLVAVLILVGLVLTFPTFFQVFAPAE